MATKFSFSSTEISGACREFRPAGAGLKRVGTAGIAAGICRKLSSTKQRVRRRLVNSIYSVYPLGNPIWMGLFRSRRSYHGSRSSFYLSMIRAPNLYLLTHNFLDLYFWGTNGIRWTIRCEWRESAAICTFAEGGKRFNSVA